MTGISGATEATAIIIANLLDPCVDTNMVSLDLPNLSSAYSYFLGQNGPNGKEITHDALNIVTTPT